MYMYKMFMVSLIACMVTLLGCSHTEETDEKVVAQAAMSGVMNKEKDDKVFHKLGVRGLSEKEEDMSEEERKEEYPKEVSKEGIEYEEEYLSGEFSSAYSVRLMHVPIDTMDFERVVMLRAGDRAVGIAQTEVDGELWYKMRLRGKEGWGLADHLKEFDAAESVTRNNRGGAPISDTLRHSNTVYTKGDHAEYMILEEENEDLAGIEEQDELFYIWGGTETFSMFDNSNTHFVLKGDGLKGIEGEESIIITDAYAGEFNYKKLKEYEVNSRGVGIDDGVDYWEEIVGEGDEERITFQITDDFETSTIVVFVPDYDPEYYE